MATSRTGTSSHKRWRREVLAAGQRAGVTHCPLCGVELDYSRGLLPNSAEPDHLLAWADGGRDTLDNGRVICRLDNQKRGNGHQERRETKRAAARGKVVTTLVDW